LEETYSILNKREVCPELEVRGYLILQLETKGEIKLNARKINHFFDE